MDDGWTTGGSRPSGGGWRDPPQHRELVFQSSCLIQHVSITLNELTSRPLLNGQRAVVVSFSQNRDVVRLDNYERLSLISALSLA